MMLSHLPVERVKIYQLNFTKFIMQKFQFYQKTENSTTSQHGSELKFFSTKKTIFRFAVICFMYFFVCLTNASILPEVYLLT